jgi:DNA-binding response OmpR family regulator
MNGALRAATVEREMRANKTAKNRPPRVLVVEDDAAIARMLHIFLRSAGFEVTGTAAGDEALRALEREPPDAVVLDLLLPNGEGEAVLDRLRRKRARRPRAWVVTSALDRAEATRRYGCFGNHFLAKPFDPRHLLWMLKDSMGECGGGEQPWGECLRGDVASPPGDEAGSFSRQNARRGEEKKRLRSNE